MADGESCLTISNGVPQGPILGPLLITLYINNIIFPNQYANVHFYADDTVLYPQLLLFSSLPLMLSNHHFLIIVLNAVEMTLSNIYTAIKTYIQILNE